jgi:hypothetical protein
MKIYIIGEINYDKKTIVYLRKFYFVSQEA